MIGFSNPDANIAELALEPGSVVVDLGAGSGFYTLSAARAVGSTGKVYAVDIQKDLLTRIRTSASTEGLFNVDAIWGDIEKLGGTQLKENVADVVIVANTFFQIKSKREFLSEAKRVLRSGGRLLVIDWTDSFGGLGPHPNDIMPENTMIKLVEEIGFKKQRSINAGPHHYGIIFTKA